MFLEQLPLTSNGKVDRKSLPKASRERPALNNEYAAPENELESRLAQIWASVLGYDQIGVTDSFFHLGGNSLLAVRVTAAAREQLQIEAPVALLFDHPTVRQWIKAATAKQSDPSNHAIDATRVSESNVRSADRETKIAIVGMAARFPGAKDVGEFWQNLIDGVESIRFFKPMNYRHTSIPSNENPLAMLLLVGSSMVRMSSMPDSLG